MWHCTDVLKRQDTFSHVELCRYLFTSDFVWAPSKTGTLLFFGTYKWVTSNRKPTELPPTHVSTFEKPPIPRQKEKRSAKVVSQTQEVATITSSFVDTEVKKGVKLLQLMVTTSWVWKETQMLRVKKINKIDGSTLWPGFKVFLAGKCRGEAIFLTWPGFR